MPVFQGSVKSTDNVMGHLGHLCGVLREQQTFLLVVYGCADEHEAWKG